MAQGIQYLENRKGIKNYVRPRKKNPTWETIVSFLYAWLKSKLIATNSRTKEIPSTPCWKNQQPSRSGTPKYMRIWKKKCVSLPRKSKLVVADASGLRLVDVSKLLSGGEVSEVKRYGIIKPIHRLEKIRLEQFN